MNALLQDQQARGRQRSFSACSPEARFDERRYIDVVVAATGVQPEYVYPQPEAAFEELADLTWHQDEPFGSTSIYAQWCVFRLAAEAGVKVMLDGQGADEQLAGYHPYFGLRLAKLAREGKLSEVAREMAALRRMHTYGVTWSAKQMLNCLLPEAVRQPLRVLARKPSTLDPAWLDMARLGAIPRDPFLQDDGTKPRDVYQLSHAQLTRTNLQMLLHWEDRDSMAHSVEARIPFLDYRVVEFVLSLPEHFKVSQGTTKRVLRRAMSGILPEAVRTRADKLGFVTAEELWLQRDAAQKFEQTLEDAVAISRGVLRADLLSRLRDMQQGRRAFDHLVWRAISFGAWMRRFSLTV